MLASLKMPLVLGTILWAFGVWILLDAGDITSLAESLVLWPAFVIAVVVLRWGTRLQEKAKSAGERAGENAVNRLFGEDR